MRASAVDGLFFVLAVPLWFGHRVSSAWLAYATPAYRPLLATQRLRFVVAPLAIAVACFVLLLVPESVLPMSLTERAIWFAVVDYLLVSYHFAAQHFGLLSLYRARAGRVSDAIARRRGGCAPRPSCRRCWRWASRLASSITCWIALPSASPHPK